MTSTTRFTTTFAFGLLAVGAPACGGVDDRGYHDAGPEPIEVQEQEHALITPPGGGILCPTTLNLSTLPLIEGAVFQAGPPNAQGLDVVAELTDTHSKCTATRVPRQHIGVVAIEDFHSGDGILLSYAQQFGRVQGQYFTEGPNLIFKVFINGVVVSSTTALTCPTLEDPGQASSGTWHSRPYTLTDPRAYIDTDITRPRSAGVFWGWFTCTYKPRDVAVDFPRLFGSTRDVSTNLEKTGFYRNYHVDDELWGRVCEMQCNDQYTCAPGNHGCDGFRDVLIDCIEDCIDEGW